MLGEVTVTAEALGPGAFPDTEGKALFIGEVTTGDGALNAINGSTDLATLFGAGDLKDTLEHAIANGGQNFQCYAIGHTNLQSWEDVVDIALIGVKPEFVVVCKPVTAGAELTTMNTKATALLNGGDRLFFLAAYTGIGAETWAVYLAAAAAITTGLDLQRVMITPLLFGSELGAFAGRLIADPVSRTPMRVATGSVVNPGAKPVDSGGVELSLAEQEALDGDRFSVFQWYNGMEGIYFADGNTLEATGGDFPVVEYLRVTDKAARQVRIVAIKALGDDTVENTPAGNKNFGARLAAPLFQMAQQNVRELKPLAKDAITVTWPTNTTVKIYMKVRPLDAPKDITVAIQLMTG